MAKQFDDKTLDRMEKIANDAAVAFTDSYYIALNKERDKIAGFYVPPTQNAEGQSEPQILWQGHNFNDAQKWQSLLQQDFPQTFYHVNKVDCQVMNHHYYPEDQADAAKIPKDENMSFLIVVDGHVRLNQRVRGTMKHFNESFVMVRNKESGSLTSGKKKWLVQSQSCRLVASYTPPADAEFDDKDMEVN